MLGNGIILVQVPKPYAVFFGDDKLDEMRVKKLHEMDQRKAQAIEGGNDSMKKIQPMNVENWDNDAEEEVPYGDDDMSVDAADGYGDDRGSACGHTTLNSTIVPSVCV
ncbi:hypothetical protein FCM35_KLT11605 [Carex littledalei]|uniref:Uncharacterized protein n=1 Tax=Carex littledalei TaxID=544730 RepID=A0A833QIE6_9POAL|nr:hypothetical protein FCM35_KLT11605 [Carex littledalei]